MTNAASAPALMTIFQGLAISLMAGEIASLFLSRLTVPVLYYMTHRRRGPRGVPGGAIHLT